MAEMAAAAMRRGAQHPVALALRGLDRARLRIVEVGLAGAVPKWEMVGPYGISRSSKFGSIER